MPCLYFNFLQNKTSHNVASSLLSIYTFFKVPWLPLCRRVWAVTPKELLMLCKSSLFYIFLWEEIPVPCSCLPKSVLNVQQKSKQEEDFFCVLINVVHFLWGSFQFFAKKKKSLIYSRPLWKHLLHDSFSIIEVTHTWEKAKGSTHHQTQRLWGKNISC